MSRRNHHEVVVQSAGELLVRCFLLLLLVVVLARGTGEAATCLDNNCHQPLVASRYLHGPVAAEMAGAKGCVVCHQPAGGVCTTTRAGVFALKQEGMCLFCHGKGTGTIHSETTNDCLKCHDPHGSATSPYLVRDGG